MNVGLSWHDMLHEYYGVYMPKGRPELWMQLLQERSPSGCGPHTTPEEVAEAIRWVREKRASERDDKKVDVDLNTLIIWVRWYRKNQRSSSDIGEEYKSDCAMCMNGWVTVWPYLPKNPTYSDFSCRSGEFQVPCPCTKGRKVFGSLKDYQGLRQEDVDNLNEAGYLGVKQTAMMREIQRKEVEAMLNAPAEECPPDLVEEGVPF